MACNTPRWCYFSYCQYFHWLDRFQKCNSALWGSWAMGFSPGNTALGSQEQPSYHMCLLSRLFTLWKTIPHFENICDVIAYFSGVRGNRQKKKEENSMNLGKKPKIGWILAQEDFQKWGNQLKIGTLMPLIFMFSRVESNTLFLVCRE